MHIDDVRHQSHSQTTSSFHACIKMADKSGLGMTGQPIVFVGTGQTYSDLKNLNVQSVVQALFSQEKGNPCAVP